jgi:hypothetical protein
MRFFGAATATRGERDQRERSNRRHHAGTPNPVSVQLDLRIRDRGATPDTGSRRRIRLSQRTCRPIPGT